MKELQGSSDKNKLGYTPLYEERFADFADTAQAVLEIGVRKGDSIKMWREYFTQATIYGFDWGWPRQGNLTHIEKLNEIEGVNVVAGDQSSLEDINLLLAECSSFDIIIEDGSHMMDHQQLNFAWLFEALKPGGWYVIEDIHTSFRGAKYGVNTTESNTTYKMFTDFKRTGVLSSQYLSNETLADLSERIEVDYINRDICFIKKLR